MPMLIVLIGKQLEPLAEQQLVDLSNLQQSSQQAEDATSQGMEALLQSLAETLSSECNGAPGSDSSSGNVANYMGQMAMAMGKLGTLEGFINQAKKQMMAIINKLMWLACALVLVAFLALSFILVGGHEKWLAIGVPVIGTTITATTLGIICHWFVRHWIEAPYVTCL
ncbi:hypothetical protein RJ641_005126 [Dillenia turbinata]|uniref:DOG1 domain-containing protein n=1 Tax=Dillenia turbinata TaxID=194707 RepID=A0AAN8Z8J4_9MAGN